MMTLPEFKAWVEGMTANGHMSHQLMIDRIRQKLKDECTPVTGVSAQGLFKQWQNPADHSKTPPAPVDYDYILGPFGPEQPM
jgi:hypothetical protein